MSSRRSRIPELIAVVLVGATLAAGCQTDAYKEDGIIQILNDTSDPVLLWKCREESCGDDLPILSELELTLKPGDRVRASVSTVGVPNPWLVLDKDTGRRLGCLPLVMPDYRSGVVARVSERVPCRSSYDPRVAWPPDQ